MDWRWVTAILAAYGFLKEIRPSEPYITAFLTGPDKNFTEQQVNQEIYPVSSYANLALLVVIFLATDFLRYKPIVVVQSLSAVATYSILSWGQGIPLMQLVEVLYGLMWAADVAYFTYMYAKVGREHYGLVSATARVGYLLGRSGSGALSQAAVSLSLLSYLDLQYVTLGAAVLATVLAVSLPAVPTSSYFHKAPPVPGEDGAEVVSAQGVEPRASFLAVGRLLWQDLKHAFSQTDVVKWSVWWALSTGGFMMALSYYQILWQETVQENGSTEVLWNGAFEAVYTCTGAGAVWLTTRMKDYSGCGDVLVAAWSLVAGAILLVCSYSSSMPLQYGLFFVYGTSYHAAVTIASAEVAKRVRDDAHGLVFGFNTLVAYIFQTLLTVSVAGEGGLELSIRMQYTVYGSYHLVIGVAYLIVAIVVLVRTCIKRSWT